jgi:hypothetical protein
MRYKASKVGAASDSTVDVRLGYEREEHDDTGKRARGGSDSRRGP